MSLPMTKIDGVPSKDEIREGMAHFIGTGPFSTKCGDCKHRGYYRDAPDRFNKKTGEWEERQRKVQSCAMYLKLAGRHGPPVDKNWDSCKYFERAAVTSGD